MKNNVCQNLPELEYHYACLAELASKGVSSLQFLSSQSYTSTIKLMDVPRSRHLRPDWILISRPFAFKVQLHYHLSKCATYIKINSMMNLGSHCLKQWAMLVYLVLRELLRELPNSYSPWRATSSHSTRRGWACVCLRRVWKCVHPWNMPFKAYFIVDHV